MIISAYIHSSATDHCYKIVSIFVELFCKIFSLQLSRVLVGIWDGECITIKCSNCLYNLAHFGSAMQRYAGYCSVWVQSIVGVIRLIPALCHRAASTNTAPGNTQSRIVKWRQESSWFSFPHRFLFCEAFFGRFSQYISNLHCHIQIQWHNNEQT